MVLDWTKADIDGKESSLYNLLNNQADLFEQSFQGEIIRVIMDRILSDTWADNQRWDGYKLDRRYRVHLRVQKNSHFEGWLCQATGREC